MTTGPRPQTDVLAAEFARAAEFRRALRRFLHRTEEIVRQYRLTPQRYQLLLFVKSADHEESTIGELADAFQLAQSTVTELVQRAEEAGLVRRQHSGRDGRVVLVRLTAEGDERLLAAFVGLRAERDVLAQGFRQVDERFREIGRDVADGSPSA